MAEKILSQAEVDALLKGVTEGAVETQQPELPREGIRSYDLTSQERIIRGRMPSLEVINERFARIFQVTLSSLLRKPVDFMPGSIEIIKFGEFIKRVPMPSSINLIKMEPLRGHILLVIDARMVFMLLDHLFGGSGQTHVKTEGRDFTTIEQRFIRKIVEKFVEDLERAWTPVHPVKVSFARSEINPQFAMIVVPTEVVIAVTFRLEIEDDGRDIFLALPYPTIEPIRDKLYGGFQSDHLEMDRGWVDRLKKQLRGCRVSLSVDLGDTNLSVQEVSDLSVGDVILLDQRVEEDLELKVEGRPKFYAKPGIHRGNIGVQIRSLIHEPKEESNGG